MKHSLWVLLLMVALLIRNDVYAYESFVIPIDSKVYGEYNRLPMSFSAGEYDLSAVPYSAWTAWASQQYWIGAALVDTPYGRMDIGAAHYYNTANEANAAAIFTPKISITLDQNTTLYFHTGDSALSDNTGFMYVLVEKLDSVCDKTDTNFPALAINENEIDRWTGDYASRPAACVAEEGEVQSRTSNCRNEHRCVKKTDECPKVRKEKVGSYVSPRDGSFHEDIALNGTAFGLQYSSADLNVSQSGIIAYGWRLDNLATLSTGKLYVGGDQYAIDTPFQENGLTVVKYGTREYLLDANDSHVQTRDIYTKEMLWTFTYDAKGLLVSVMDAYANTTTLNRDSNGTLTSITAPHGQITYLNVDTNGDLTEVQYEDLSAYNFTYANHLMTRESEPNNNLFTHSYDSYGDITKVVDAEQGIWRFNQIAEMALIDINVTRAAGDNVLYKKHFLVSGSMTLTTEETLPTGDTVLYESAVDDSSSSMTMCGEKTTRTYLVENGVLVKDPVQNRRIPASMTRTEPSGLSKTTTYTTEYTMGGDRTQSIVQTSTSNGATVTSVRDYNLSTETVTSAEGIIQQNIYDTSNMLLLSSQSGDLLPVSYVYDTEGRISSTTQGDRITSYTYDVKGNTATVTDPDDKVTRFNYDLLGRRTEIIYPDGHTTHFAYDANGNMNALTTPIPTVHAFDYNGVNKRTFYTSPMAKTTQYIYDKQRRLTQIIKPSGKTILTTYTNSRISQVQTPEGMSTYTYDCGNQLSSMEMGSERINFVYDGSLLKSVQQIGVFNQTLGYAYNSDFRVNNFTYAGQTVQFDYNKDGLLILSGDYTLKRNVNNALVTSITDGTMTQSRVYNDYGELLEQDDGNFVFKLTRDKTHITAKTELLTGYKTRLGKHPAKVRDKHSYKYIYDENGRLVEVTKDRKTFETYIYDANGNRASATVYGQTVTANYTLDDQLDVYGQNTYRYDDDGYLVEKTTPEGITTYEYGTLGELRSVVKPDGTNIRYYQNAANQRIAKEVNGIITEKYLWTDFTTLLAVYDGNNSLLQRFEYADQRMPVSMIYGGNKYYLHYDQIGTLKAITDTSGNIVKSVDYDSFGDILSDSDPSFKVPFGFAGGLYDPDTGLTRFGYRDYDAETGKWTAKDPIGFAGGDTNPYGYVLGDPVDFVDSWGLTVYLCKAPVNGISFIDHHWIKTDSLERGMWNDNDTSEWYDDVPYAAHVAVRDEEYHEDAMCREMPFADENKVNEQLENFRPLGIWTPWNQCQSFGKSVLDISRPPNFYKYMDNRTTNPYFNPNGWVPRSGI